MTEKVQDKPLTAEWKCKLTVINGADHEWIYCSRCGALADDGTDGEPIYSTICPNTYCHAQMTNAEG